jgi:hypothetical protein
MRIDSTNTVIKEIFCHLYTETSKTAHKIVNFMADKGSHLLIIGVSIFALHSSLGISFVSQAALGFSICLINHTIKEKETAEKNKKENKENVPAKIETFHKVINLILSAGILTKELFPHSIPNTTFLGKYIFVPYAFNVGISIAELLIL